jgi:hypothetical protein
MLPEVLPPATIAGLLAMQTPVDGLGKVGPCFFAHELTPLYRS